MLGPYCFIVSCLPIAFCQLSLINEYCIVLYCIPVDVLVQTQVNEESESPAPTSFPSSVHVVETLLSGADGQLTPLPAHVLAQTSVSEVLAYSGPTSLLSSVPDAANLLSKADSQRTPNRTENLTKLRKDSRQLSVSLYCSSRSGRPTRDFKVIAI